VQSLSDIRRLLEERGLRPDRRLGQNFLHDHRRIDRLIDASGVGRGSLVLEVGPGTGVMTEALLERGVELVCSELDRGLADLVEERLGDRLVLVRGDCLGGGRKLAPEVESALGGRPFTLVANLPYQAASPLMADLAMRPGARCLGQFVTIQKEVADRLLAPPGTKAWGTLGVIVRAFAEVERIDVLPPGCFWPQPKVTSAMIAIRPIEPPAVDPADAEAFARFVTAVFGRRRKQLGSTLGRGGAWPEGVAPDLRPEALDASAFAELFRLRGHDAPAA